MSDGITQTRASGVFTAIKIQLGTYLLGVRVMGGENGVPVF